MGASKSIKYFGPLSFKENLINDKNYVGNFYEYQTTLLCYHGTTWDNMLPCVTICYYVTSVTCDNMLLLLPANFLNFTITENMC